jgi:hypothetical protein
MSGSTEGGARRLRAVGGEPVADAGALAEAAAACVGASRTGIAPRALGAAVAGRLGVEPDRIDPDALSAAIGVLIASGRIDEAGGRLVPAAARESRRAV